jgi:hypothetical protein
MVLCRVFTEMSFSDSKEVGVLYGIDLIRVIPRDSAESFTAQYRRILRYPAEFRTGFLIGILDPRLALGDPGSVHPMLENLIFFFIYSRVQATLFHTFFSVIGVIVFNI